MTTRLRPILSMDDVYGPDRVFVPRAHDRASDWLPTGTFVLDFMTGAQLAIGGDMPVVCSEGFNTEACRKLLEEAGLEIARTPIHFCAGQGQEAISNGGIEPDAKLVLQHAFPPEALQADRYWIDSALLRYLNNKANLAALTSEENVPPRKIADRPAFFAGEEPRLPIVLKAVTDQSSGGGSAVMVCRTGDDLRRARQRFEACAQIVAEQPLDILRSPCLNFAVMRSGQVRYLGFADQDVSADGIFRGNWLRLGSSLPRKVVDPAMDVVCRAAEMGYRGLAGVDMAICRDGQIYVLDLNFRLNSSTASVLLAPALRERCGPVTMHVRKLHGQWSAEPMAKTLAEWVRRSAVIPLNLFDPQAAGYRDKRASLKAIIIGASRREVLAIEEELAGFGIA